MKNNIANWVKSQHEELEGIEVYLKDGSKITLHVYLDRTESIAGDYEPPWGPNEEGIVMYAGDLGIDTDEDLEQAISYAWSLCEPKHKERIHRDNFGGFLDVATLNNCSKEEFNKAVTLLLPYVWGYGNNPDFELPETIRE